MMRKLMWFSLGFFLATLAGIYLLAPQWYLLGAGICAIVLLVCLLCLQKIPKCRIATALVLGCLIGFVWQAGYEAVYLAVAREADETQNAYVIHASDYSYETDYGSAVDGYIMLNHRSYHVKVYLPEGLSAAPGDRITGYFSLGCTLPGESADSSYHRADGIFLVAYPLLFNAVEQADSIPWYGFPAMIRRYVTELIHSVFPEDVISLASGLLMGDTEDMNYDTDTDLKISGIRHIVAVSGLHVTILFSMIFLLTGRNRWLSALIGIPLLLLFAAIVGFSPSISRACMMHGILVIAALVNREYDSPTALSFAVLIMIIGNPWTASSVGFQLSVGCLAGILLFAQPMQTWMMDRKRLGRFKGWVARGFQGFAGSVSVSVSAAIITTPLCGIYFGVVSLISVVTNLLTLWIIIFIFYGILLTCLVGLFSATAAAMIAWVVAWPMRFVLWVSKILAAFPLSAVYTESVYIVAWLVLCYILLVIYLLLRKKQPLLLIGSCFVCLCISLMLSWTEPLHDECRVTVLDVGQGQCVLLQSDGKNFLVDCGGDSDVKAADRAASLLLSQGIFRLDGLILTHYDADHASGAIHLLTRVSADALYLPECVDSEGYREQLLTYQDGQVYTVSEDLYLRFAQTQVLLIPSEFGMTDNESGLCILFQTENCDILVTGDRGFSGEAELMRHVELPELEVLIVGHHGSKYSTGEELLSVTTPQVAIISASANNRYGHPSQEVLYRLEQYGCLIYRTDENGTVVYRR